VSETPTLIERLEDQGCDRMPFTDDHKHCICRLTNEAAREITSLRALLDEAKARIAELEKALRDIAEAKMPGQARYIARTTLEASERGENP